MIERKINQNELRDMICIIFNKNNHVFFKKKQNKKKTERFSVTLFHELFFNEVYYVYN